MVKVTFTLDDETVAHIRRIAGRLRKPQSQVVREAIRSYAARDDRLTEEERREKLRILDEMLMRVRPRPTPEVERELRQIRRARHQGGRRHQVD